MQIISYLHLNLRITFTQRPHKLGETFVSRIIRDGAFVANYFYATKAQSRVIRDTKNTQKFRQSLKDYLLSLS